MFIGTLPPVSNRADWIDTVEVIDEEAEDGEEMIDLTGCDITMSITDGDEIERASASTDAGTIVIADIGVFQFTIPRATMTNLIPGTYQAGVTIARDGETVQAIIGTVNVLDGIVPR